MPAKKSILSFFSRFSKRQWMRIIAVVLIVLLAVLLCITINMRSHIQRQYTSARDEVGSELYTQIDSMCAIFDRVDIPGQDVQANIIPTMKQYYVTACALNSALENGFGRRYGVMSTEQIAAFDSAFAAYENAFKTGRTTMDAKASMQAAVDDIRTTLRSRYDGERLKAS